MKRRQFLQGVAIASTAAAGGCLSQSPATDSTAPSATGSTTGSSSIHSTTEDPTTDEPTTTHPTTQPPSTDITDWSRSTNCGSMHDSVIRVEMVLSEPRGETFPIKFTDLSEAEQSLLQPVVTNGGVGFCDPPHTFRPFLELAADRVSQQQEAGGPRLAFLRYRDQYYGLYIEQEDQVYSSE